MFVCNCGCTITDEQQQNYTVTTTIRTKRLSNLCRLIFLLLLLFICNCGCTITDEEEEQQNCTATTTRKKDQSRYISCSIFKSSIEEADYSQTFLLPMYPPVEASHNEEQYYIRSV